MHATRRFEHKGRALRSSDTRRCLLLVLLRGLLRNMCLCFQGLPCGDSRNLFGCLEGARPFSMSVLSVESMTLSRTVGSFDHAASGERRAVEHMHSGANHKTDFCPTAAPHETAQRQGRLGCAEESYL